MRPTSLAPTSFAKRIKKILWFLGLHAFSLILFFVLIDFIFAGFIFYKYVYLAETAQPKPSGSVIKFNSQTYQDVITVLQPPALPATEPSPSPTPEE